MSLEEDQLKRDIFKKIFDTNYEQILNTINDKNKKYKILNISSNILINEIYKQIENDYLNTFKNILKQLNFSNKQYEEKKDILFNKVNKEINEKIKELIQIEIAKKINENEFNELKNNNIKNKNEKISQEYIKKKKYPISLGIKLGALYTCYSISGKNNGIFQTNVLLSNIFTAGSRLMII